MENNMKKVLKRILTLSLSLIFVMTLCPCFSVSAADVTVLTAEALAVNPTAGNQVPTSIVADLSLPTDGITWTSSNPAVISNQGVVTRPLAEDANVTLTANDGVATKEFNFVVKAKRTNVVAQDSFYYAGLENANKDTDIIASMNGWSNAASTLTTASQIKTEADGNKYLELGLNVTGGVYLQWNKPVTANKFKLDFDIMLTANDATGNAGYVTALLRGTDANGSAVSAQIKVAHITPDSWFFWGEADNGANGIYDYIRLDASKRLPASIEFDLTNKTITGTLVGGGQKSYEGNSYTEAMYGYQSNDQTVLKTEGVTFTTVEWVRFFSNGSRNMDLDNFVLSADADVKASDISFEMLTAQTPKAVTENLDLTASNVYVNGMGGTINWASSNPGVVVVSDNTAVVTRPINESENVTLTATVSKNGKTTTKDFTFTVPAKKINIVAQEGFNYEGLENTDGNIDIFASEGMAANGWSISSADLQSKIVTDNSGNKSAEFKSAAANSLDWAKTVEKGSSGKINISFDYKHPSSSMDNAYIVAVLENASGSRIEAVIMNCTRDNWFAWGYNGKGNGYWTRVVDRTSFQPVSIELDLNNMTYTASYGPNGYWGDANYQTATCTDNLYNYFGGAQITESYEKLVALRFRSGGTYYDCFDNLVLSTDTVVSASDVNFEMLTTQDADVVTENLSLASANALIEELGGEISWSTADNDVLAISDNTVVVTRPLSESKTVTLTATVINDGKTTTKDFVFTVISKNITIVGYDKFNYEKLENTDKNEDIFASMNGWVNKKASASTASQIKTDAIGNKYLEIGHNIAGGADVVWNKSAAANYVKLGFDITIEPYANQSVKGTSYLSAILSGTNANGEPVNAEVQLAVIGADGWFFWSKPGNKAARLNATKMLPVAIEFDMANKTISGSLIGTANKEYDGDVYVTAMTGYTDADTTLIEDPGNTFTTVSQIRFSSGGAAYLGVDNFMLTTESINIVNTQCSDAGIVSAKFNNTSGEVRAAMAICVGYKGDMIDVIETQYIDLPNGADATVNFLKNFSEADSYTIYLWDKLNKIQPLCKTVSVTK